MACLKKKKMKTMKWEGKEKEASSVMRVAPGITATLDPSSVADEAPLS